MVSKIATVIFVLFSVRMLKISQEICPPGGIFPVTPECPAEFPPPSPRLTIMHSCQGHSQP